MAEMKSVTCPNTECGHTQDEPIGVSEITCEECGTEYRVLSQAVDMTGGDD